MGPAARVRVDANGGWDVDDALAALGALAGYGLEYAEQPCATVEELRDLRIPWRARLDVPVAADESIRKAEDPLRVRDLEAADIIVVKVAPLGGVPAALAVVEEQPHPADVDHRVAPRTCSAQAARPVRATRPRARAAPRAARAVPGRRPPRPTGSAPATGTSGCAATSPASSATVPSPHAWSSVGQGRGERDPGRDADARVERRRHHGRQPAGLDDRRARTRTPPSGATLTTTTSAASRSRTRSGSSALRMDSSAAMGTSMPLRARAIRRSRSSSTVAHGCSAYSRS